MRDLRVKLGVILALALLPLLAFSMWRSYSDYTRDQALIRSNADLTARIALTEINSSFETTKSILRFTSTLLAGNNCRADLTRFTNEYPRFHNIIQTDSRGEVQCSAKPLRSNAEHAETLLSGLSEDTPYATGVFSLPSPNGEPERVVTTAYASYVKGEMTSIFVAVEDIKYLLSLLQKSKILEGSEMAVFNGSGEVLGGDWSGGDLQTIAQSLPTQQLRARLATKDKAGRSLLIIPTPADDIYLAVASDRKNVISWNNFNPITYAIIPILAWLFGFGAIWLSTDQLIVIHIRRMRRAMLDFAKGNQGARVGDLKNPPSSIYTLGQNFDQMADSIVEREATIRDSLVEKETLLREIHHRVKNNLQIIISLLNMQERKLTDKQGLAAIVETRSRINAIALVHRGLYESKDLRFVDMQTFLDRLLPELTIALGLSERRITVSSKSECEPMEADTATPVALFIVEALTNAVKHGVSGGGHIDIKLVQVEGVVTVSVSDTGTTVSQDKVPGSGMGTKLMKGFARQLGGRLEKNFGENGYEISLHFRPRDITPDALIMK